jgi:hydroxylaminobenzene mutase
MKDASQEGELRTKRFLALSAAGLFLISLLTGLYAGGAMTGVFKVNPSTALAAHLGALMGTFLIAAYGWTLPMLRYGDTGRHRLALVFVLTSYANWAITATKAALNVNGLEFSGDAANRGVFVVLQVAVVIPTMVAAVAWVAGLVARGKRG